MTKKEALLQAQPKPVVRTLALDFEEGGSFCVREGDKSTGSLNIDEAIGLLYHAGIKHLPLFVLERQSLYEMRTLGGWAEWYLQISNPKDKAS